MSLRRVLVAIALAFTAYFLVRGIAIAMSVPAPWLQVAASAVWLAAVALAIWAPGERVRPGSAGGRAPSRLPVWAAAVVLAAACASTAGTVVASGDEIRAPLSASVFGITGMLLTILAVRRRPTWAWLGVAALTALGVWSMGLAPALSRGLVGAFVWVGLAQLLLRLVDRAYGDTAKLVRLQQASSAWQATHDVRRSQRRQRVQFALEVAGPVLSRAVQTGGRLTDRERAEALITEGTLRDEVRAHLLMDDEVRTEIRRARERGAGVTVIDDDGLADLDDADLATVRAALAEVVRGTDADRLIVRTTRDRRTAVTVVGRRSAASAAVPEPDDTVVLWREIPRP